ncbi:MAG: hypothetical protein A2275_13130 [Bacteroidetes bacterium RIFOXYA12_FULL_35_11]|nr:MAG: hypothetical protein A2X01_09940 [Bacteroidetes bacterium GWF2_35_48]OFY73174.1 MAG: hypothetical protein A2275_13130 [Bacteroidetes bacterium RIFOXYA12_FULL_35_11]OFZ01271.1 MAG: hypothetical protein A2491_13895 [Bacteroidetes bacterium RIFOXYC12_FULL_35_7]HBX50926.1 hypothetical protein [Bacteroidales bacterium]
MNSNQNSNNEDDGKTVAVISYITLIGWIIALVMHSGNKTKLGSFHLRQMLGLMIIAFGISLCSFILAFIPFLGWLVQLGLSISIFIFWLLGLMSAINGEQKPVPYIGKHIQKMFENMF